MHPPADANLLLFAVVADGETLSAAIPALQSGPHVLLPLGELAQILTIAITTRPEKGIASGFVVNETREFSLNVAQGTVSWPGGTEALDNRLIDVREDDIYVASKLLVRWLPIDLDINFSSLSIKVTARETLPFQMRLERERAAGRMGARNKRPDPGYPREAIPYRVVDTPFIDQTVATSLGPGAGSARNTTYSTYLTADMLGMESALYLTNSAGQEKQKIRYSLARHDPDAGLLGPLNARSVGFGNIPVAPVENVSHGSFFGSGVTVSNAPLSQPTSFDRHSLQGDLPPGWDVELFYNDMLVATQQSRADGKYNFDDQPLMYGPNEFRLVFHGPLGQTRVERQSFALDRSLSRPGEFYYNFANHRDVDGLKHSMAQFNFGIAQSLTATGGVVSMPVAGTEQRYTNVGLRGFWQSMIFNGYYVSAQDGGSLAQGEVMTRLGDYSIDASHTQLSKFTSDYFTLGQRQRQKLRLTGPLELPALPRLPLTLEVLRDSFESGDKVIQGNASVSSYQLGTWITNRLAWTSGGGSKSVGGTVLLGRRLADIGLNAQFAYSIQPERRLTDVAVMGNKNLSDGYTVMASLSHSMASGETVYGGALNKGIGSYGYGITAGYSSRRSLSIGIQFFMSMSREPRKSAWSFDAIPKANSGAASVCAFMDKNMNGVMDEGETPIKGVGFTVNGGGLLPTRTDESGVALLSGLQAFENTDVAVEIETLEEPEWTPVNKGVRIVPRPGRVAELNFPVVVASEIDGTVYLSQGGKKKGIGAVVIELVDAAGKVVSTVKTSWDGYYVMEGVRPGKYSLRVSPEQIKRQDLADVPTRSVNVGGDGKFFDGMDFVVSRDLPDSLMLGETSRLAESGKSSATPDAGPLLAAQKTRIEQALRAWSSAWSSRDTKAYLSAYSAAFVPADGRTREQWASWRESVLSRPGRVTIEIESVEITPAGPSRSSTRFRQRYRSPGFSDVVAKELEWENVGGRWLIVRETAKAMPASAVRESAGRPQ